MRISGTIGVEEGRIGSVTILWQDIDGPIVQNGTYKVVGVAATLYCDDTPYEAITVTRITKSGKVDQRSQGRTYTWYGWHNRQEFDAVVADAGITVPANVEEAAALLLPKREPDGVYVYLDGGIVRQVWTEDGTNVPCTVHDYDVEGQDESDLQTDAEGRQYLEWGV